MILPDTHIHTKNSPDGVDSALQICEAAVKAAIGVIAITDHFDATGSDDAYQKIDAYQIAFEEAEQAKEVFSGKLMVMSGIEMGESVYHPDVCEAMFTRYDFDFVLSSLHSLADDSDYYYMDYKSIDCTSLLRDYFNDLLAQVKQNWFDSLAHIDYPARYMIRDHVTVDLSGFSDQIDGILKTLAENGKALEINTSSLRRGSGLVPDVDMLKRFRSFGGEFVTVGSDAHRAADVGKGIDDALALAETAGFRYVTVFRKRKPELIRF